MENKDNKGLYWYGFRADLKKIFGILIIIAGIIIGLIVGKIAGWIIFVLSIIMGIWSFFMGKEERFDYERQSGSILHKGDW